MPTALRRMGLINRYGFECDCARCVGGLRHKGEEVDSLMEATLGDPINAGVAIQRSEELLASAERSSDATLAKKLVWKALEMRRRHCHPTFP